jgi:hypothetical protein
MRRLALAAVAALSLAACPGVWPKVIEVRIVGSDGGALDAGPVDAGDAS